MLDDTNSQHVFSKPDDNSPALERHANALRQAGDIKRYIEVIDRLDARLIDARVKANQEVAAAISCSKRIEASPAYLDALHGKEKADVDMPQAQKGDTKGSVVEILINAVEQMRSRKDRSLRQTANPGSRPHQDAQSHYDRITDREAHRRSLRPETV